MRIIKILLLLVQAQCIPALAELTCHDQQIENKIYNFFIENNVTLDYIEGYIKRYNNKMKKVQLTRLTKAKEKYEQRGKKIDQCVDLFKKLKTSYNELISHHKEFTDTYSEEEKSILVSAKKKYIALSPLLKIQSDAHKERLKQELKIIYRQEKKVNTKNNASSLKIKLDNFYTEGKNYPWIDLLAIIQSYFGKIFFHKVGSRLK